jgi:predicted RecA/RadA family phage recombinase
MATHTHLFSPGAKVTCTAKTAVTGGRLVMIAGNREVSPAAAKSPAWFGVAATDAKAGERVLVLKGGVHRLLASGAIVAGDLVVAAADGKVAKLAAVTTPTAPDVADTRAVVGLALTGGTDVLVEIDLSR